MLYGYARVSTREQNESLQLDALLAAGVDRRNILVDRISGSSMSRPKLDALLRKLRSGDVVVVWRLDRLGRNTKHLITLVEHFALHDVGFKTLTGIAINTEDATGKLIFKIFAALAEFERDLIIERTKAGLAAARLRGRVGGRPAKLTTVAQRDLVVFWLTHGYSVRAIEKLLRKDCTACVMGPKSDRNDKGHTCANKTTISRFAKEVDRSAPGSTTNGQTDPPTDDEEYAF